jgi:DNA-binding XRE family transcriptional regulator
MLIIEDYKEITNEKSYFIITVKYDKDFPLLKVNFDIDSEDVEVDGIRYTVNDCLVSDNGEWINLICDRIKTNKEEERQRIGQRIADLRKGEGLTQNDLASMTGMQRNHISRIEQGRYSVGFDTLQTIADQFGMKVDFV